MEALQARWEADESVCWTHRRIHVYRLLSAGFGPPTPYLRRLLSTTEFLGYLRQALDAAPEIFREPLGELGRFFRTRDPARTVEEEHRWLFPRRVSPRGCDHGGPPPGRVRTFYRETGLALVASPLPPDHVSVETAFLASLAEGEMGLARRGLGAGEPRQWARRFLGEHVGVWVPRFAREVQEERGPFYPALARVLSDWVALEAAAGP